MFEIFFYSAITILILFFLGFGLTWMIVPAKLKSDVFWLSPWLGIIFIIFSLVTLGLFGFSVRQASPLVMTFLILLNGYVFLRSKKKLFSFSKRDLLLISLVIINIVFHLYPLVKNQGFATTISLGNNDIHAYATTADYLLTHSIADSLRREVGLSVNTLLRFGYRWGGPIVSSFFLNLLHLEGFQYLYIFEVVLFALTLPLIYLLVKILSKDQIVSSLAPFFSVLLVGFNVNLLYMLYHNFLGQIIFGGLFVFTIIFLVLYFNSKSLLDKSLNSYDYIIGAAMIVLYFSYHEGVILIILPLGLYYLLHFILIKKNISHLLWTVGKMVGLVFMAASYAVIHATNFTLFYRINEFTEPVGWQLFRSQFPYANPFEMLGFYSIHAFPPLPSAAAWILSLTVVLVVVIGFSRTRYKLFIASFISVYTLLLIFVLSRHQFWLFNRMVTYSIPLFSLLFSVGVAGFFSKNNPMINLFLILFVDLIVILSLFSASKLNARFTKEHLAVDKSLISLKILAKNQQINEPIYSERILNESLPWWRELWAEYFLFPKKQLMTAFQIKSPAEEVLSDSNLLLVSKPKASYLATRVLFDKIVWENAYYRLVKLCMSSACLLKRTEDLSVVDFGKNHYEDSLLVSGWSVGESSQRWSNTKEAVLRLVDKSGFVSKLQLEALTLKTPQEISVYFDNQLLGRRNLSQVWQTYSFDINKPESGVHVIKFIFSHLYRPSQFNISQDDRTLSANFRTIKIE